MHEKKIGEPCPTCQTPLQRRRSTFRTIAGDIAFCACCSASYEISLEEELSALARSRELAAI